MGKFWSQRAGFKRIGPAVVIAAISLVSSVVVADDNSDADARSQKDRLAEMFYQSMAHWKYNYAKMPDRKAGVACIPWERLDAMLVDNAIFEALGFSYSVAKDEAAIQIATQGCHQMKAHYKISDCACELVLMGDQVVITVPEERADN